MHRSLPSLWVETLEASVLGEERSRMRSPHLSAGTLVLFVLGARHRIRCLLVTQEGRALAKVT